MICDKCNKQSDCVVLLKLCSMSDNFSINDCDDYEESKKEKYRKIAKDEDLMKLVYDYFTGELPESIIYEQIKRRMLEL